MDVTVNIKIKLKPADWTEKFGEEGEADIRQAVKAYVGELLTVRGVFASGEVPAEINWR
jgi:hypothetical protein